MLPATLHSGRGGKRGTHHKTGISKMLGRKAVRKRAIRYGLVSANLFVLIAVTFFVATSSSSTGAEQAAVAKNNSVQEADSPVDHLTSYDVAANIAKAVSLPEKAAITNQAQSAKVSAAMNASDAGVAAKPQVVNTALKSWRDITQYTVLPGDTVPVVAQKFGVRSESIRWSNNLGSDTLTAGSQLWIPPVDGIVYQVASGDTPQALADKFYANADKIAQYNDAEETALVVGRHVIIPDGKVVVTAAASTRATTTRVTGLAVSSSFTPNYGSNGYDWGWCTYYAAARSGAPSNWGNANTWAYYARLSGWTVSSTPVAGAIFQTTAGWAGHVGIVEEVYDNGTMKVSDMNGIAGFGRVGYAVVPISTYPNFIYR